MSKRNKEKVRIGIIAVKIEQHNLHGNTVKCKRYKNGWKNTGREWVVNGWKEKGKRVKESERKMGKRSNCRRLL
jgi:hypothetical protein